MKAILVIEVPNDLDISLDDIRTQITLSSKDVTKSLLYLKYDNAELKPMPQKEDEFEKGLGEYGRGWRIGYNYCIDELLGEE